MSSKCSLKDIFGDMKVPKKAPPPPGKSPLKAPPPGPWKPPMGKPTVKK